MIGVKEIDFFTNTYAYFAYSECNQAPEEKRGDFFSQGNRVVKYNGNGMNVRTVQPASIYFIVLQRQIAISNCRLCRNEEKENETEERARKRERPLANF